MIHSHAIQGHKVWTRVRVGQPVCGGTRASMHSDPAVVLSPDHPKRRQTGGVRSTVFHSNRGCSLPPRRRAAECHSSLTGLLATLFRYDRSLIPAVVWAGAERLRGCSATRSNFIQPIHQLSRQALADVSHLFVAFRDPGSDELEPSERRTEACSRKSRMRFNP